MPSRNTLKQYVTGGYYHIYNRGVEKRDIFLDEQDYVVFLHYLKYYLSPPDPVNSRLEAERLGIVQPRRSKSLSERIGLICFCLMPNHLHLLIQQTADRSLPEFTQALFTAYSMYFNRKYERVGGLFQGCYKAILISTDQYLLHLSRYIHLNPAELGALGEPCDYPYSSYKYYLKRNNPPVWLRPTIITEQFSKRKTYRDFVDSFYNENKSQDFGAMSWPLIGDLTLE